MTLEIESLVGKEPNCAMTAVFCLNEIQRRREEGQDNPYRVNVLKIPVTKIHSRCAISNKGAR